MAKNRYKQDEKAPALKKRRVLIKYRNDEAYRLNSIKFASMRRKINYRDNEEYRQNTINSATIRKNIKTEIMMSFVKITSNQSLGKKKQIHK
jgi:hypothetical protein